jgi:hypothetical protein
LDAALRDVAADNVGDELIFNVHGAGNEAWVAW